MPTTLQLAIAAAQQGRPQEAAALAARAVKEQPKEPQAHYLCAMLAATSGDNAGAIVHLENLLTLAPSNTAARYNLAVLLQEGGRPLDALAAYDALLRAAPGHAQALNNKGVTLTGLGRWDEAIAAFDASLTAQPDNLDARLNRASALLSAHRLREALATFDAIIVAAPACAPAHLGRGDALLNLRRMEEAVASYEAALKLAPRLEAAAEGRRCALDGDRWAQGLLERQAARVAARPDDLQALFTYACLLGEADRRQQALTQLDILLARAPDFPGAHVQRAMALVDLERPEEALESARFHQRVKPDDVDAILLEARALALLRQWDDAAERYGAVLARAPADEDARFQLGLLRLLMGDFAQGWSDYEARFGTDNYWRLAAIERRPPANHVHGVEPGGLSGRRVLVLDEQGVGDVVMFASIVPDLVRIAASVTLVVAPRLQALFARSFPQARVVARPAPEAMAAEAYDLSLFIGSLGYAFRRSGADFPGAAFLRPDDGQRSAWKQLLGEGAGPVVGVSWKGGTQWTRRGGRSLSVGDLSPLLDLPGARFVSLQHGETDAEKAELQSLFGDRLIAAGDNLTSDLDGLAALISCLDAVLTVQNTNVHLAGALGAPCWAILPESPEWRYGREGGRMPWYASVRLLRRSAGDDEGGSLRLAVAELSGSLGRRDLVDAQVRD